MNHSRTVHPHRASRRAIQYRTLGLLGGIVGVLLGVAGIKILETIPAIRGLLEADRGPELLVISVGIAVLVGVINGLYPAWYSSRLTPSAALQG